MLMPLAGCATPSKPKPSPVAEGWYILHSDAFYKNGLVRVAGDGKGGARVTLLDHFGGGFTLSPDGPGAFTITRANVDLEDVRRRLSGSGTVDATGTLTGECRVWVNNIPGISRDHRDRAWTLRPIAEEDAQRALAKLRKRYPGRLEALGW